MREPLTFAAAAAQRTPLLLAGQLGGPPPDLATFLPATTAPMLALALLLLLGVALALRPLWRRPLTRFFALGGALAVLPCCATFPSDRLLLLVGLSGFGLCAQLLTAPPAGWPARALCLFLPLAHGVAAPLLLPLRCLSVRALGQVSGRASVALPRDERPLVLVTAPDMLIPISILAQRAAEGGPMPRFGRLLGVSSAAVTVERRDARTLRLRSDGFLAGALGVLVRGAEHPLQIGVPIELGAWSVTPLELSPDGDGRPRAFDVRFHDGLDDPSLRWMTWRGRGLVAWTLPPVGGAAVLPAPDPGAMFSGGPEHEGP